MSEYGLLLLLLPPLSGGKSPPTDTSSVESVTVLTCQARGYGTRRSGSRPYRERADGVGTIVVVSSRD